MTDPGHARPAVDPHVVPAPWVTTTDVVLVGGGIMSATLGTLLSELQPNWSITVLESLDSIAQESSDAWNNAGTGHAALCELNYTPQRPDGSIDVSKALQVNEWFQLSRQLWSSLVDSGRLADPGQFLRPIPHLSLVFGDDVDYLRKRHEALAPHPLFQGMEFSTDPSTLADWMPLVMKGRDPGAPVAATRAEGGTDVNFGQLTRLLFDELTARGTDLRLGQRVTELRRLENGNWGVLAEDTRTGRKTLVSAPFVFLGSGGGALPLLQSSGIPEARGFGGFPVSGQFLRCTDPAIIEQHHAKVYGKAAVGAPPMSVPHLDTRWVDGAPSLLFGPYAGFSPKFLKNGSIFDLPASVRGNNLAPMLDVARGNLDLIKYLVGEVAQTSSGRLGALREFVPTAQSGDWELITAGQRVQIIKKGADGKGTLQFGTEVVSAADGSIAALLGASPGASSAVDIMFTVLRRCFPGRMDAWTSRLTELVPSFGRTLDDDPKLLAELTDWSDRTLQLRSAQTVA
ncbi:malate:quinone oxidoreductase [Nakamurella sp. YIM 132087]|uniref:Probable malate:quinone oxidoreductase n=1 Tax=Nakamurella alba TaxID=2665158 RepID=A0A7K1FK97_9ACTN|nr:malate:quinone oxidoreductase [Nakamurella alba]MTD14565.1 malate:quinone oxidoreductase [Nakamurella alba]